MRNLLFRCAFDGRGFHGYQVQKNAYTVMEAIQDGIEKVLGKREPIIGCSRTDSGVHALEYYFNMHTDVSIPENRLVPALNRVLPKELVILGCREVPEEFHARYSAAGKQYIYKLYGGKYRNPFYEGLALYYRRPVDIPKMNDAASRFLGTHDFSGFSDAGSDVEDTVRTLTECRIEKRDPFIVLQVTGDGFLYHMVRVLTGTLLKVNEGRLDPDAIGSVIAAKDRALAGKTVPPHGLYLNRVFYQD